MFNHNNFQNKSIQDIEQDPYLLSLYQLEQVFMERKRKKEERLRRQRIGRENQLVGDEMDQEQEEEVNGLEEVNKLFSSIDRDNQTDDQLNAIQLLIKKEKERKNSQMRAKISNKLIDQMLIFALINKNTITEILITQSLNQSNIN